MYTTELVFVLDRSGSMQGLESDTIGGFNSLLAKQKKEPGRALVSTVLFDSKVDVIHDRMPVEKVAPLTDKEYCVGGCTALLDAVGGAIHHISNIHKKSRPEDRPDKTLVVVITDGMENSSREYSYAQINDMVTRQKKKYDWEFLFLGANIDAIAAAASMGIEADRAANYRSDRQGTALNYQVLGDAIHAVRACQPLTAGWKKAIDDDYDKG